MINGPLLLRMSDRLLPGVGARRWRPNRVLRHLRRSPSGIAGGVIVLGALVVALVGPWIAPSDPNMAHLDRVLRPPAWMPGGDRTNLLGTDTLGRDLLARVIYGARISLTVGLLAVALSAPLGVIVGMTSGYFGGAWGQITMRIADGQLAIPFLLLGIAVVGVLGPTLRNVILVLGVSGWVLYARVARAETLSVRNKEFVEAACAAGCSDWRIISRHILPNLLTPVTVIATFAVAHMILVESSLSFLGLGVPPPTPTWGALLNDGLRYIEIAWWLSVFPGIAIAVSVLGVNLFGDWVRDYLDPRTRIIS
ncbi:MAG: ABC transporter permease [bacterium]